LGLAKIEKALVVLESTNSTFLLPFGIGNSFVETGNIPRRRGDGGEPDPCGLRDI